MVERYRGNPEGPGFRLGHVPLRRKTEGNLVLRVHFQGFQFSFVLLFLEERCHGGEIGVLGMSNISGRERHVTGLRRLESEPSLSRLPQWPP